MEAGMQRYGVGSRVWRDSVPFNLKYAFTDDWGIRLGGELVVRAPDPDGGTEFGIGDTSLVLKRRFAFSDSSAAGIEVGANFPTAPSGLHAGSGGVDLVATAIYSADLGAKLHVDVNLDVIHFGDAPVVGGRDQLLWAVALSRDMGAGWGLEGEVSGIDEKKTPALTQVLVAASYSPYKSIAWDFGLAHVTSGSQSSWALLAGATLLLTRLSP
jgi:hypothetical protein